MTNLRDQKGYRDKHLRGYLRAFSESWIVQQPKEAQARYRQHNEKVKLARAISKALRKRKKELKEAEGEALRLEKQQTKKRRV